MLHSNSPAEALCVNASDPLGIHPVYRTKQPARISGAYGTGLDATQRLSHVRAGYDARFRLAD